MFLDSLIKSIYLFIYYVLIMYLCINYVLIMYLLIFRQNSMIFEKSPNSLTESYFTEELKLGES